MRILQLSYHNGERERDSVTLESVGDKTELWVGISDSHSTHLVLEYIEGKCVR